MQVKWYNDNIVLYIVFFRICRTDRGGVHHSLSRLSVLLTALTSWTKTKTKNLLLLTLSTHFNLNSRTGTSYRNNGDVCTGLFSITSATYSISSTLFRTTKVRSMRCKRGHVTWYHAICRRYTRWCRWPRNQMRLFFEMVSESAKVIIILRENAKKSQINCVILA